MFMHGSLLRGSWLAKVMLHGLGLLMLVPPRSWRESHNYHHANVARLNTPAIAYGAPGEDLGSVSDAGAALLVAIEDSTGAVPLVRGLTQE